MKIYNTLTKKKEEFVPIEPGKVRMYVSVSYTHLISAPASVAPTLFKMDFSAIASLNFVVVVFAFLFVDIFDTLGLSLIHI